MATLFLALLNGLDFTAPTAGLRRALVTITIAPPPPEPPQPEQAHHQAIRAASPPAGAPPSSGNGDSDRPIALLHPAPPTVPGRAVAGADDEAQRPGDSVGAGTGNGVGNGTGNGGGGDGGGGNDGGAPANVGVARFPRQIEGRLHYADLPEDLRKARSGGDLTLRYRIGIDGRVSGCVVLASSGRPDLDAATCDIVTRRFRFRPARDARGNPVAFVMTETHGWSDAPAGD